MIQIEPFYFERARLDHMLAQQPAGSHFGSVDPFPHVVFDEFLPTDVIRRLVAEFPAPNDIEWFSWGPGRTRRLTDTKLNKLGQSDERFFPPFIRHFMNQLLSATFVSFIEKLTGISGLIVDPSHNGCGLHSTGRGGRLMIHTDVNRHPHSKKHLHQVLNFILYLNDDWKDDYNGHLELWTGDRKPCKTILPIANRAVLFETGTRSFHGHPEPINCPEGRRRNSLAVYYYCYDRPPSAEYDGMQRSVHWVPTSADDRGIAAEIGARTEGWVRQKSGMRVRVAAGLLPVQLGQLQDDAWAYLTIAHEESIDPVLRQALRASRVAAMFPESMGGLENHYLLGFLRTTEAPSGFGEPESQLLVCDRRDGALYVEHPTTSRALFFGYAEMLEGLSDGDALLSRHNRVTRKR